MKQKKKLLKLIKNGEFKNFINFVKLEKYLKINFNKPVSEMISMLEKFEELLEKQINLLKITELNNNTKINNNLFLKKNSLEHQLDILKNNKKKLKLSIIL